MSAEGSKRQPKSEDESEAYADYYSNFAEEYFASENGNTRYPRRLSFGRNNSLQSNIGEPWRPSESGNREPARQPKTTSYQDPQQQQAVRRQALSYLEQETAVRRRHEEANVAGAPISQCIGRASDFGKPSLWEWNAINAMPGESNNERDTARRSSTPSARASSNESLGNGYGAEEWDDLPCSSRHRSRSYDFGVNLPSNSFRLANESPGPRRLTPTTFETEDFNRDYIFPTHMESRPAQGYHAERPAQDDIWPSFVSPPTVEGIRRYSDAPRPRYCESEPQPMMRRHDSDVSLMRTDQSSFAAQSRASPGTFNAGRGYGNYVDDSSFRESYGTNRYSFPSPSPGPPSASRQQHQRAVSLTALSEFHGNGIKNTLESPAWADTTPRPSGSSIVAARDRAAHSQQVQEQLLREYQEDAEWSEAATKFMESRPGDFAAGLSARQTDPGSVSGALFLRPVRPASMPTLPQLVNPSPAALVKPNPWAQQKVAEFVAARGLNPGPFVFDVRPRHARYFVIKSNSATNIVASVQHNVWSSTELGNRRLDNAFKANQAAAATAAASGAVESQPNSPVRGLGAHDHAVFLFFSVTSSGRFCGVARMTSAVDWNCTVTIWEQAKRWKGAFNVEWIFVKDVPNNAVRHLKVSANENKPVSNSRDTQELTEAIGHEMLRIYCEFHTQTSVLEELFTL